MKNVSLMRKATATLVLVALCLSLLPINAFAANTTNEEFTVNGYRYVITSSENNTVSFAKPADSSTSYSGEITVPQTVQNNDTTYTVTAIHSDAFANATGVTKVTLPDSITKIPDAAFIGCTGLTSITFGNAVTSIGDGAFSGCSALTSLTIPNTVTSIGGGAFAGLGATSLTIPASVKEGDAGLIGYTHLDGVTFADGSPFKLDNGVLYCGTELVVALDRSIASCTVLDGTTSIGKNAFAGGGTINGVQVDNACTSLTSVTLPASLETIGDGAFGTSVSTGKACTSLASVTFTGNGLKEIGKAAFGKCTALSSIDLPDSLTTIGESAFQQTALTSVVIPEGVTTIPKGAFSQVTSLKTVVFTGKVTSVGMNAFSGWKSSANDCVLVMANGVASGIDAKAFGVQSSAGVTPNGLTVITSSDTVSSCKQITQFSDSSKVNVLGFGLTVSNPTIKVLSGEETTGNTATLTADVPTGCTLTAVSADSNIATAAVGTDGKTITITSVAEGETTITIKITLDNASYTLLEKTATVTVIAADKEPAVVVPATEAPKAADDVDTSDGIGKEVADALNPTATDEEGNTTSEGIQVTDTNDNNALVEAANALLAENTVSAEEGEKALKAADVTVNSGDTVSIVIQPYLDVTILAVSKDETAASVTSTLKLEITPMYRKVATTADPNTEDIILEAGEGESDTKSQNAVELKDEGGILTVSGTTTVKIPLPNGFMSDTAYVKHTKGGRTYIYTGEVKNNVLSFENPHGFSTFEITSENPIVATITKGDVTTNYASLQDAVDEVTDGGTIQILKSDSATVSRTVSFTVKAAEGAQNVTATITGGPRTTVTGPDANGKYTCVRSSGSGGVTTYPVSTPSSVENGSVSASVKSAGKGATVTITATPDEGYEIAKVTVTDAKGNQLALTDKGNGKYTFVMPASKVDIDVTFQPVAVPAPPVHSFTDVAEDAWYADAVQYVFENGLMAGISDTTFAPNATTTRGMIATILYRLEHEPAVSGSSPFTDVEAGLWYTDAIAWASANGVVKGYSPTTFGPNDPITREQMAAMLYRYAAYKGYDVAGKADLSGYVDADQVSSYATEAMEWANLAGLINGTSDTTLSPTASAIRAQVAAILMRFCENVVK